MPLPSPAKRNLKILALLAKPSNMGLRGAAGRDGVRRGWIGRGGEPPGDGGRLGATRRERQARAGQTLAGWLTQAISYQGHTMMCLVGCPGRQALRVKTVT